MAVQALYSHNTLFKCCAGTRATPITQIVPGDKTNGAELLHLIFKGTMRS